VQVFGPEDPADRIESIVRGDYSENGGSKPTDNGQFSSDRFAFLFKPGTYAVDLPVGYYTQVAGLGTRPDDVVFQGKRGVYCEESDQSDMGGALSTFWREAENFKQTGNMLWAVSQAAPLRRIIVDGDLQLAQFLPSVGMGYASGGFVGNLHVTGKIQSGSQQQWCTRNSAIDNGWTGAVWNMAFVGTEGGEPSHCGPEGGPPSVNIPETPVIAEKPFVTIGQDGRYSLVIPRVQKNRKGYDFGVDSAVDFSGVFVARATDSAAAINAKLAAGLHVVLSPGIYYLDAALQMDRPDQVLLGLGMATLVAAKGDAAIRVGNVDGVRIAGVLLQAGSGETDVLLQWGDGSYAGSAENPGFLHDVFARVGGPTDATKEPVRAHVMLRLSSGNVVGDNLWLWRADHDVAGLVKNGDNPCDHGLVVTGDHVTMYGLAVEHTLQDLVQWSGQHGRTYFFQSELPYDVTGAWGDAGYVGYRVNNTVMSHKAYGVGVYHFFRDHNVTVKRGIAAPAWLESDFVSPLNVHLTGNGRVEHVLNNWGGPTSSDTKQVQWSCEEKPRLAVPAGVARLAAKKVSAQARAAVFAKEAAAIASSADGRAGKSAMRVHVSGTAPVRTGKAAYQTATRPPTTMAPPREVFKPMNQPIAATDCAAGGGQCAGEGYRGNNCCPESWACVWKNQTYAGCLMVAGVRTADKPSSAWGLDLSLLPLTCLCAMGACFIVSQLRSRWTRLDSVRIDLTGSMMRGSPDASPAGGVTPGGSRFEMSPVATAIRRSRGFTTPAMMRSLSAAHSPGGDSFGAMSPGYQARTLNLTMTSSPCPKLERTLEHALDARAEARRNTTLESEPYEVYDARSV